MWVFLQAYSHMRDDLGGEGPTVSQYADRWRLPIHTAHRNFAEFNEMFPSEENGDRVCNESWDGIARQTGPGPTFMAHGAVKVREQ